VLVLTGFKFIRFPILLFLYYIKNKKREIGSVLKKIKEKKSGDREAVYEIMDGEARVEVMKEVEVGNDGGVQAGHVRFD
jgi:hypothetical protein